MTDVLKFRTAEQRLREDVVATAEDALELVRQQGDYVGVAIALVRKDGRITVLRSKTENQSGLLGAIEYLKYRALLRLDEGCADEDDDG